MNSNPIHTGKQPATKPGSSGWPASKTAFPRFYTMVSRTAEEQTRMRTNLAWRQGTSMPIVKVVGYTTEPVPERNLPYCQLFKVELEPIVKSVTDLDNLDINEATYLIRQFLLGIQTICIKFNCEFDVSKGFYGINQKGQAKVWLTHNFMQEGGDIGKSVSFAARKVNHVIESLFEIVGSCLKPSQRPTFESMGAKLANEENITYSQAHTKLRKICNDYKVLITNSLALNRLKSGSKGKQPRLSGEKKYKRIIPVSKEGSIFYPRKQLTSAIPHSSASIGIHNVYREREQMRSGYNSPTAVEPHLLMAQNWQAASNSRPKITWHYTNSASIQHNPAHQRELSHAYMVETVNNSIRREPLYPSLPGSNKKDLYFCRSVPIKVQNQRLNSESRPIHRQQQVTIKQFNPLEEQDHPEAYLEVSEPAKVQHSQMNTTSTKNPGVESKLEFGESLFLDNIGSNKKSNATTQISNNTQRGKDSLQDFKDKCYNVNKLEEMIDNSKTIMNSIMIPSPIISRRSPECSRTTYNFGGLIPIEINCQKDEIEGKEVESLQASRDYNLKLVQQKPKQAQHPQEGQPRIDFDLLGGIDLMAKFFANDNQDLKESVWCGEEKRAEHLQIKLEKLGHFGRDISASFVPNDHE